MCPAGHDAGRAYVSRWTRIIFLLIPGERGLAPSPSAPERGIVMLGAGRGRPNGEVKHSPHRDCFLPRIRPTLLAVF
jgi:hypothetical protein